MALPEHVRPYHLTEATTVEPSGTFNVDITSDKTAATTAIQTLFDDYRTALQADYPPDFASAVTAINQLETDTIAALNANIPDDVAADSNEGVTATRTALQDEISSEGFTYDCPQCGTEGVIPTYQQDGVTPTGETIECPTCDGFGYTDVQYTLDNNSKKYVPA